MCIILTHGYYEKDTYMYFISNRKAKFKCRYDLLSFETFKEWIYQQALRQV